MAGVVADVSADRASLVFAGPGGLRHREPLERCWDVRFERVPPVRSFPSRRGQVRFAGTQVTVPMLTEPTSAQREAFTLIGAPVPLTLT